MHGSTYLGWLIDLQTPAAALDAVGESLTELRPRLCERQSGHQSSMPKRQSVRHEPQLHKGSHSSSRLGQWPGEAGRLAGLRERWGVGVPRSPLGAERAWGGSSPSLAALARLEAGLRYARLLRTQLSPTSCQHAYKSAVLALGLTSYPPNPQPGAQHGAVIAILAAVRRAMHFGGRARAFCMRGRRT